VVVLGSWVAATTVSIWVSLDFFFFFLEWRWWLICCWWQVSLFWGVYVTGVWSDWGLWIVIVIGNNQNLVFDTKVDA